MRGLWSNKEGGEREREALPKCNELLVTWCRLEII